MKKQQQPTGKSGGTHLNRRCMATKSVVHMGEFNWGWITKKNNECKRVQHVFTFNACSQSELCLWADITTMWDTNLDTLRAIIPKVEGFGQLKGLRLQESTLGRLQYQGFPSWMISLPPPPYVTVFRLGNWLYRPKYCHVLPIPKTPLYCSN